MNRPDITKDLSRRLEKHIDPHNDPRIYWSKEVTFDYGTENQIRVDYMLFKPRNNSVSGIEAAKVYCYEIKSSVADFQSKHGHNFIGDYNYYVMPEDVFRAVEKEIPYQVGILCPCGKTLDCIKPAKRKDRNRPVAEIVLMMWRSSRRELLKAKENNETTIEEAIRQLESLKAHSESMIDPSEPEGIWKQDIEACELAIQALRDCAKMDKEK